jgi:diguanylate cyclase (GGDEF)-like protein
MADDGIQARLEAALTQLLTVNGVVALVGGLALIFGLVMGTPVWWIVCGLIVVAAAATLILSFRGEREHPIAPPGPVHSGVDREDGGGSRDGEMKKLLFDDFQTSGARYVVKEIDEEKRVIPSAKSTQPAPLKEEVLRELEILDFFDLDSDIPYTEAEPKSEFHSLLNKVLLVLKDVLFANTVAFFWANREKQKMVVESFATDSKDFTTEKRFPIEEDLVSKVALSGKAELLGRVNPVSEKELFRYYTKPANVKSVLAVPVFFKSSQSSILPVGVIVADSRAEDAFGQETLVLLGRFTKLVSALVKSYTDKFDLLLDSELLSSIRRMQDRIRSDASERTVLDALADEVNRLANWDCLTISMYSEDRRGWVLQKVVNKAGRPYVAPDQLLDIDRSTVGEVIRTNRVETIPDLSIDTPVRFHNAETMESRGSFLCIPVSSFNRCYGALTLESANTGNFSGSEVETIYRLVESAASSLEVLYMNDLVKDFVIIDHLTGLMTRKHFMKKLEEEVRRAEDFNAELAFVSIAVDVMEGQCARYGKDAADVILNEIAKLARSAVRSYDVLGRQESDTLGVLLINTAASDAYLWAEKMRKMIASHVITLGMKNFSVTVSVGVCGLTEGMRAEDLLSGTSQVLGKAVAGGGNLVRVY